MATVEKALQLGEQTDSELQTQGGDDFDLLESRVIRGDLTISAVRLG